MASLWRSLAILSLTIPLATANLCEKLDKQNIDVQKSPEIDYTTELTKYWSTACGDLKPTCIVFPTSAAEMANVVKELHKTNDTFAVKSGGHMPNNGFASVEDGILVSTRRLDQIVYHDEDQTADVGPGLSWEEAQKGLDGTNQTIVGGRMGGVGIGGYMLGGGLSFLSSQYGWSANNVVDYEVVIANGSVVHANHKENSDLFHALKGGGSNFGIVTNYKMKTHLQDHKVWGGNYIFNATSDSTPKILSAVHDFTANYPDDKAAIILTADHTAILKTWILFLFYDAPSPPEHVFRKFQDIKPLDTTKTWDSYYDLLKNNDLFILKGQRYLIGTETTPLPSSESASIVMQSYYDHWTNVTNSVLDVPGVISSMSFQPMPGAITQKARDRGGDLLNFDPSTSYIIFELDFSYLLPLSDDRITSAHKEVYTGLNDLITKHTSTGALPDVYRPLFMNDAYKEQDYWGRIRKESREVAKSVKDAFDPEGFWEKRMGGGFWVD